MSDGRGGCEVDAEVSGRSGGLGLWAEVSDRRGGCDVDAEVSEGARCKEPALRGRKPTMASISSC